MATAIVGKIMHVFFNTIPNCRYTFKDGTDANFLGGKYLTDNEVQIRELSREVANGHPHIYTKADHLTEDTTIVDPMVAIREKVRAELLAEMAASTDKTTDRGSYEVSGKLEGIANTDTIAAGAADSSSNDGAQQATAATTTVTPTPVASAAIVNPALAALSAKIAAAKSV